MARNAPQCLIPTITFYGDRDVTADPVNSEGIQAGWQKASNSNSFERKWKKALVYGAGIIRRLQSYVPRQHSWHRFAVMI